MKNILVICGPTASGKTSLALQVAETLLHRHSGLDPESRNLSLRSTKCCGNLTPSLSVNLLSADSRQIYQGLDIVTGKDLPPSLSPKIRFFGLDLVQPDTIFNLSDYTQYARQVISDSLSQKVPLIIVGGTGLYLKAITSDLLTVHVPPNAKLRARLESLDLEALKKLLKKLNPQKFSSLNNSDANNPRRLIRAIEISSTKQQSLSCHPRESGDPFSNSIPFVLPTFHQIGLRIDRETQQANIRERVVRRLKTGAVTEVENLIQKYPHQSLPIFTSLGVREISRYLSQAISREKLIDAWTSAEIDYARRQMVWFQKQPEIIWYDMSSRQNQKLAIKLAKIFI